MPPRPPPRKPPSPADYQTVPPQSPPRKLQSGPDSSQSHQSIYNYYMPSSQPSSSTHGDHAVLIPQPRRKHRRTETAQGVATGSIGSIYGPYSYESASAPLTFNNPSRFSNASNPSVWSDQPPSSVESHRASPITPASATPPQQTTDTVPAYLWDAKDPDLDDPLHNPDPVRDALLDARWNIWTIRGWINLGAVFIICGGLMSIFAFWPIVAFYQKAHLPVNGYNLGGINGSGQIPDLPNMPRLIDPDTPQEAYTRVGHDGKDYTIVFSDEFNVDGRTFYEGDDPFWEGVDLHYWATGDLEWYSPDAITTADGKLVLTLTEEIFKGLNFKSGMLQSWNKFCFTNGYIEVSVSLPGSPKVPGLWPAAWTMGNLGRAGHGASTEGTWPYSYDSCDVGTFPNQTRKDGTPEAADGGSLSYLPGQRLSACTCPDSDHPGPSNTIGRAAPEIDIFEALINLTHWEGEVSQSVQAAPYNADYQFTVNPTTAVIYDDSKTFYNGYQGGVYQQTVSAPTLVGTTAFDGKAYKSYAFEYWTDQKNRDAGYVTWFVDDIPTWTMYSSAIGPDPKTEIGSRLIAEEPMYIILNLGMAPSFQQQDFKNLRFPAKMYVDYVRVYQQNGQENIGCDTKTHPTEKYINDHINAYTNPNLTTWHQAGYTFPRNSGYDGC